MGRRLQPAASCKRQELVETAAVHERDVLRIDHDRHIIRTWGDAEERFDAGDVDVAA
jgi:hypothetical protein